MSAEMVVLAVGFFLLSMGKEMLTTFLNKLTERYSENVSERLFKKTKQTEDTLSPSIDWESLKELYGKHTVVEVTFSKNQQIQKLTISRRK